MRSGGGGADEALGAGRVRGQALEARGARGIYLHPIGWLHDPSKLCALCHASVSPLAQWS